MARRFAESNVKRAVTGLLVYNAGSYLQLLEGDPNVIATLFGAIRRDPRHCEVERLMFVRVTHRAFPKWAMGLWDLSTTGPVDRDRVRWLASMATEKSAHRSVVEMFRAFQGSQAEATPGFVQAAL